MQARLCPTIRMRTEPNEMGVAKWVCCCRRMETDAATFVRECTREEADGLLRVGFPGDRPDARRCRWRQGRASGGAFADRRPPRAGWLLRDDGCLRADHGGSAVDRRSAVAPEAGRPGRDTHGQG